MIDRIKPVPLNESERWLPVSGFEDRYDVSNLGRVWSRLTNRILKPGLSSNGYLCVSLYFGDVPKHCKSFCVHQLVLATFVGPCQPGYEADHGLKGRLWNELTNLEYVTREENMRRNIERGVIVTYRGQEHVNAKLSDEAVRIVRKEMARRKHGTCAKLARRFKVDPVTILHAARGESYKNVV